MSEQFNPNDWLTTAEAAAVSGYSQSHIRRTITNGRIPAVKRGKTWFIERQDVIEYARRMQSLGTAKHTPKQYIKN